MTGEITLTGQVLPIGGVKREGARGAARGPHAGSILPRENEPDLEELPPEAREELEFILADTIEQVLEAALRRPPGHAPPPAVCGPRRPPHRV